MTERKTLENVLMHLLGRKKSVRLDVLLTGGGGERIINEISLVKCINFI